MVGLFLIKLMSLSKTKTIKKNKKSVFRRLSDWLHLWLGIGAGIMVIFIALTGCIYVFQTEITSLIYGKRLYVEPATNQAKPLPLSVLKDKAEMALKGKAINFITTYPDPHKTWEFGAFKGGDPNAFFYFDAVDYYDSAHLNPYTGEVTKVFHYKYEFFNIVKMLHWSLLINHPIGQLIIGWSTVIFIILLITGMIHWWPKNLKKSNVDKSFKIKWTAKFKRLNYDLHNVPGFYALLIALTLALTGLVWAFQWFQSTVYAVASLSVTPPDTKTFKSDTLYAKSANAFDIAFETAKKLYPRAKKIGISPAIGAEGIIYANAYKGEETYYDSNDMQFDQYSGKLLNNRTYQSKNAGERLIGMNYDIHVGAILGLPGKILAFCASFIAASLPITGFIIWWGRRKKSKSKSP